MRKWTALIMALTMVFIFNGISNADLEDGLKAYYPFDGSANDDSGNGYDGTVIGATLTADKDGNPNSAYSFNGNDYISFQNNPVGFIGMGSFSFSCWFKTSVSANQNIIFLGNDIPGALSGEEIASLTINPHTDGAKLHGSFTDGNPYDFGSIKTQIDLDSWYHAAVIYSDQEIQLYVNGVRIYCDGSNPFPCKSSSYYNFTEFDWDNMTFGTAKYGGSVRTFLVGALDEVRIYDRELTEVEIQELAGINQPPVADAGPDLSISKYHQNATVIEGTASDPDGGSLQYRWLKEGTVLQDWQDVGPGEEAYLDLSELNLFVYGSHTLTLEVTDGAAAHSDDMVLTILTSAEIIAEVAEAIQRIIDNDPGSDLADKLEDALAKLQSALYKHSERDNKGAVGELKGAIDEIESALEDYGLDLATGKHFMDQLAAAAWQLASDAINLAIYQGGDSDKIEEAQDCLASGEKKIAKAESLIAKGKWKKAVKKSLYEKAVGDYEDALSKLDSVVCETVTVSGKILYGGPPIPGVLVRLVENTNGNLLDTTRTGSGGNFSFTFEAIAGVQEYGVDVQPEGMENALTGWRGFRQFDENCENVLPNFDMHYIELFVSPLDGKVFKAEEISDSNPIVFQWPGRSDATSYSIGIESSIDWVWDRYFFPETSINFNGILNDGTNIKQGNYVWWYWLNFGPEPGDEDWQFWGSQTTGKNLIIE